jgi:hypothetical protein
MVDNALQPGAELLSFSLTSRQNQDRILGTGDHLCVHQKRMICEGWQKLGVCQ